VIRIIAAKISTYTSANNEEFIGFFPEAIQIRIANDIIKMNTRIIA
jgi:hypothetical protein